MSPIPESFIEFAVESGALVFGDFVTKSGRRTPYFFNAGRFDRGAALRRLAAFYAQTILHARQEGRLQFDMLFGPAYKGIALAAASAMALAAAGEDLPYAYNRKETKDHGEGGTLVGAALAGRVLIVDDVITDGAAKRESVALIRAQGAEPAGVVIMLDRKERLGVDAAADAAAAAAPGAESAAQSFTRATGTPVLALADLDHLLSFLQSASPLALPLRQHLPAIEAYRQRYGT